jgi:hypothetical protein
MEAQTIHVVYQQEITGIPWRLARFAEAIKGDLQAMEPLVLVDDVQRATGRDGVQGKGKNDIGRVEKNHTEHTGAEFPWLWYHRPSGDGWRAGWMRAFLLADLEAFIRSSPIFNDMTWNTASFHLQLCTKLTAFAAQVQQLKGHLEKSEARYVVLELEHAAALETIEKLREQHSVYNDMMAAGHTTPMDAIMDETEDGISEELETPEANAVLRAMMVIAENSEVAQEVALSPLLEKKLKAVPRGALRGVAVAASRLSTVVITVESGLESGENPLGSLQSTDSEPMRPNKKRKREDIGAAQNLNATGEGPGQQ